MPVIFVLCFIVYIQADFIFNHNYVTNEKGQGDAFFAGDISGCVLGKQISENNIDQISICQYFQYLLHLISGKQISFL